VLKVPEQMGCLKLQEVRAKSNEFVLISFLRATVITVALFCDTQIRGIVVLELGFGQMMVRSFGVLQVRAVTIQHVD
jgi:hypothetical protein